MWEKEGWTVPKTFDDLKALLPKMQKAGYAPIGFADKDGWPAMGTFDILNLRINGYDFHVNLMAGKESWQDPKVATVFNTWKELLPYHQDGALGRTWQEARAGPRLQEVGDVPARHVRRPAVPRAPRTTTWTSSTSRRSTPTSAPTRSTRRSTAS